MSYYKTFIELFLSFIEFNKVKTILLKRIVYLILISFNSTIKDYPYGYFFSLFTPVLLASAKPLSPKIMLQRYLNDGAREGTS
jgi:hypothetical protein